MYFAYKKLFAREQVTVGASPIGGTAATYNGNDAGAASQIEMPAVGAPGTTGRFRASAAVVENVGATAVYYTIDGSTPSATNGNHLDSGGILYLTGHQKVAQFRAVQQTTAATLDMSYYKE